MCNQLQLSLIHPFWVSVKWPSQTRTRELQTELELLGKALVRGAFKQIVSAAYRHKAIRVELVKLVFKRNGE